MLPITKRLSLLRSWGLLSRVQVRGGASRSGRQRDPAQTSWGCNPGILPGRGSEGAALALCPWEFQGQIPLWPWCAPPCCAGAVSGRGRGAGDGGTKGIRTRCRGHLGEDGERQGGGSCVARAMLTGGPAGPRAWQDDATHRDMWAGDGHHGPLSAPILELGPCPWDPGVQSGASSAARLLAVCPHQSPLLGPDCP